MSIGLRVNINAPDSSKLLILLELHTFSLLLAVDLIHL